MKFIKLIIFSDFQNFTNRINYSKMNFYSFIKERHIKFKNILPNNLIN